MLHHGTLYPPQRLASNMSDLILPDHQKEMPSIGKKRRGRQPRQSLLNPNLKHAIAQFTSAVGAPIVQPGGFRDFNGWLASISKSQYSPAWQQLCQTFLCEKSHFPQSDIHQLKRDVIHEIINLVVKPKSHESSKLVSTNARRQCTVPLSGNTVMTLLDSYLASTPEPLEIVSTSSFPLSSHLSGVSKADLLQMPQTLYVHHDGPTKHSLPNTQPTRLFQSTTKLKPLSIDADHLLVHSDSFHECTRISSYQTLQAENQRLDSRVFDSPSIGSLKWHRDSINGRGVQNGRQRKTSRNVTNGMDIPSLLSEEVDSRKDNEPIVQKRSGAFKSKLPSLSQLDAQIRMRERFEQDRKRWFKPSDFKLLNSTAISVVAVSPRKNFSTQGSKLVTVKQDLLSFLSVPVDCPFYLPLDFYNLKS